MRHAGHELRLTGERIGAEKIGTNLLQRTAASRAMRQRALIYPFFPGHSAQNFGDDIVAAAHKHPTAHGDSFAQNILQVVERRPAHGCPGNLHLTQQGNGRELACAPELPDDILYRGCYFLGGKFIGNRPTRKLFRISSCSRNAKSFTLMTMPSMRKSS